MSLTNLTLLTWIFSAAAFVRFREPMPTLTYTE